MKKLWNNKKVFTLVCAGVFLIGSAAAIWGDDIHQAFHDDHDHGHHIEWCEKQSPPSNSGV